MEYCFDQLKMAMLEFTKKGFRE